MHAPSCTMTQWGEECTKLFVRLTEIESTHTPLCPHHCSKPNCRTRKSNRKILEKLCSKQWMQHLQSELLGPPGRLRAYVHWHLSNDTLGRNLYRPAPYPTHQNAKYQLEMLRIRTQRWIDYIPSHLHCQRGPAHQAPYQVPLCLPATGPTLGDEKHIISQCPASRAVLHDPKFFNRFQGLTHLIDTQPFQLLDSEEQIRVALGTPPPLPNAQRFPNLETRSHSYVWRVCPRLENAPRTTATNSSIIVFGRRLIM